MSNINTFHASKWKFGFSNCPTVSDNKELKVFDGYMKSLTIPSTKVDIIPSHYKGYQVNQITQKANVELDPIQVEFKADEELKNYFYLHEWMQRLKYGQNVDSAVIRNECIDYINATLLDNEKREIRRISFHKCFCSNLGGLSLVMGTDDEVSFNCMFVYEEVKAISL